MQDVQSGCASTKHRIIITRDRHEPPELGGVGLSSAFYGIVAAASVAIEDAIGAIKDTVISIDICSLERHGSNVVRVFLASHPQPTNDSSCYSLPTRGEGLEETLPRASQSRKLLCWTSPALAATWLPLSLAISYGHKRQSCLLQMATKFEQVIEGRFFSFARHCKENNNRDRNQLSLPFRAMQLTMPPLYPSNRHTSLSYFSSVYHAHLPTYPRTLSSQLCSTEEYSNSASLTYKTLYS